MSKIDLSFKEICLEVLNNGVEYENKRRGVKRLQIPSYTFKHSFSDGFPAIGLKFLPFKSVVTELDWFLKGRNDIDYLTKNGCKIWNKDAYNWYCKMNAGTPLMGYDEFSAKGSGIVGRNYGVQWRDYNGEIDQIRNLIDDMKEDIMGSRLIVSAWNPSELHLTALPPCHTQFQIIGVPIGNDEFGFELHWYQRSVDLFLGLPFNIASYALLAKILEKITGFKALGIQGDLKCVHLYENQIDVTKEVISKHAKYSNCELSNFEVPKNYLQNDEGLDVSLVNYWHNGSVKVEMLAPKN